MIRNTQMLTILALTGLIWFSCQKNDELIDRQVAQTEIAKDPRFIPDGEIQGIVLYAASEPVLFPNWASGNAATECERAGSSCGSSYKVDNWDGIDEDGQYAGVITITNSDGKTFSWSSEYEVCAVIVKGGPGANVYYYPEGSCGDQGLVAPDGKDISHVTFCWTNVPCEEQVCYDDETAWAAGTRYVTRGNWATYTDYDGTAQDVILYAGQKHNAGTVSFSAVANGGVTITIALNPGFILDPDTDEAVKIQGYTSAPSGNPAPGGFTTYKGNETTITVDQFAFYGIHLDVLREVECED